ncbi:hypothetical protein AOLI_G00279040 [Acnodon oligacanthus]
MTTCRPGQLCHSQLSLVLRELLRGFAVSKPKSALAGVKPEWRPPAWDNRAQEQLLKGNWRKAGLRSGYIHEQILLRRETLLPDFDVMERVTGDRAALSCLSARLRDLHNLSSRLVAVNKLFPMCI